MIKSCIGWFPEGETLRIQVSENHWYNPNTHEHVLSIDEVKALYEACEKILSKKLTNV